MKLNCFVRKYVNGIDDWKDVCNINNFYILSMSRSCIVNCRIFWISLGMCDNWSDYVIV